MTEVLTATQLRRLTEHKYSAGGTSVLEPLMQKFWRWLVEQVPLWWAPNAITLAGLLMNVISTLILVFYSPDGRTEVPAWTSILALMGLFGYQALDAIDGKQARRTGSSSPLGELFDHGCDALSIVFVAVGSCVVLQLGNQPSWFFFESFAGMFLFYTAHWQSYVSGTLRFGRFDVTEAQFAVMGVYLFTALMGTSFWETAIPVFGLMKVVPVIFSVATAIMSCQMNLSVIFSGGSGKNGSTIAGTSVLSPIIPFAIPMVLALMIWKKSTSQLFESNPALYILAFGMVNTKITNKLVIAHMTKAEMSMLDTTLIGPGMLFFNQYCNFIFDEYYVLWMCLIFCTFDMLVFSTTVCRQICDHFNIYCFKISPVTDDQKSQANNGHQSGESSDLRRPATRSTRRTAKK